MFKFEPKHPDICIQNASKNENVKIILNNKLKIITLFFVPILYIWNKSSDPNLAGFGTVQFFN